jgi:hypothetical protein
MKRRSLACIGIALGLAASCSSENAPVRPPTSDLSTLPPEMRIPILRRML